MTGGRPPTRLERTLGIEPGESFVLGWSALALFLTSWASISVTNVAETLFLKRVGVDRLPWIFLLNSLLLTGTTFVVGRLAVRHEPRRLLIATLVGLGVGLLPLWLLVLGNVTSAFSLLMIAAKQLDAIALVIFWTAIGGLVSGRQGKRLFARIGAGATLGAIVGSFASGVLGRAFGIATLLPMATVTLVLAAAAVVPLARVAPPRYYRAARPMLDDDAGRRLGPLWRAGNLFRVLVLASLLAGILGPILYFEFAYVADRATQGSGGEQRLLDLYALFRGWLNVGVLLIQMIGAPAMFRRLGVPLASALSPIIYLLGLVGLSIQLSLAAGVAAVAGANLQDHAVYDPAQRILVTLFPERVRAAVTTLIDGPVKRSGAVLGNLIIIAALAFANPLWVGFAGVPVALVWLGLALALWRLYPSMLIQVATARRTDLDDPPPLIELFDGGTVRMLEESLVSRDAERCRAASELVVEATPRRAARAFARALRVAPEEHRPILVDGLHRALAAPAAASLVHSETAVHLAAVLSAPNGLGVLDRARVVQAYGRLVGPAAKARPSALTDAADDPDEAVRLAATAALARVGVAPTATLIAALRTALRSSDAVTRRIAIAELRTELRRPVAFGDAWEEQLGLLIGQLDVADDRTAAAVTLADVADTHGARLATHAAAVVAHRNDPDPVVRTAVLRFVSAVGLEDAAAWVVAHLTAEDPEEAAAARRALRALGPAAVDVLLHTLRFGRFRTREAVLAILVGLPIDPARLSLLVERELDLIRRLILQREALRLGGIAEIVLQRVAERIDEASHTTVLLMAAILDDPRLTRVGRLLGRTHSDRDRALVIEALEALLPPAERERLMPLLDDGSSATAHALAQATGRPVPTFDEAVADILATGDTLTQDLLRGTLPADRVAPDGALVSYEKRGALVTDVDTILHLRTLDLFAGLTTRQLAELARVVEEHNVQPEDVVVREGDFDDQMYFIVDGKVRVEKDGELVTELGANDFFGEIAVFDGERRSASVIASTRVRLLRLDRQDLYEVMEEHPAIAVAICQTLSRRLREFLDTRMEAGNSGQATKGD